METDEVEFVGPSDGGCTVLCPGTGIETDSGTPPDDAFSGGRA